MKSPALQSPATRQAIDFNGLSDVAPTDCRSVDGRGLADIARPNFSAIDPPGVPRAPLPVSLPLSIRKIWSPGEAKKSEQKRPVPGVRVRGQ